MIFIYVLKLQKNKYYIGKTSNPTFRLESHFNSSGSEWTKAYPPIEVEHIYKDCDDFDENKYTLKYMDKYGDRNVRGGTYCRITLTEDDKRDIDRQLNGDEDNCMNCGKPGHFVRDCPEKKKPINKKTPVNKTKPEIKSKSPIHIICERCGRNNHNKNNCYAEYDINGDEISDELWSCKHCKKEFDTEKGCLYHERVHCKSKKLKRSATKKQTKLTKCGRCGRENHKVYNCYAEYDIDGDEISDELWSCKHCNKEFDTEKGCLYHERVHCKYKKTKYVNRGGWKKF